MEELNEPQRRAVSHTEGPLVVFAGAGSGKTRVITYRIANLLARHRIPPYRILAVTFTNKAAGEMRSRLEHLAGEDITRDLWVGTFHSICARLLRRYHDEVGLARQFAIYDASDQKAVMTRVLRDLGLSERSFPPKVVLGRVHRQKRDGIRPEEVETSRAFDDSLVEAYTRYEKALRTANAVDFDDLILHIMRLAEARTNAAGEELRERFRFILVDEFQDTNQVQYRLVRALASGGRNLCVVGDDDQSIYSWRGADVRNILDFRKDFPEATIVKLEQNYRSTANVVAAALGIIQGARAREPKHLFTDRPKGDPVRILAVRDERDEAARVVQAIHSELARGISARDIAVFYRVHAQSRVLEEALRAERVPYQIIGGTKFFERAEVKDLLAYLRLLDNPRSDADLMRILNVPARGIGAKTAERLFAIAARRGTCGYDALDATTESKELASAAKKRLREFKQLVDELRAEAARLAPHELAGRILEATGYRAILEKDDSAEADARLENLQELLGSIVEYEEDCAYSGEEPSLAGYLERVSLISDVDTMRGEPAVTLMTVHSAKGLEFTTVILTGMEEETFPYRGVHSDSPEELDEERRLAYVAVTRARERLTICTASMRTLFGQTKYLAPSRFLADLPPEVVQQEGTPWGRRLDGSLPGTVGAGRASRPAAPTSSCDPHALEAGTAQAPEPGERTIDYEAFDDVSVHPGDRVFHQRFGRGVVESVVPGPEPTIVANFPGYGQRKVRAQYLSFGG